MCDYEEKLVEKQNRRRLALRAGMVAAAMLEADRVWECVLEDCHRATGMPLSYRVRARTPLQAAAIAVAWALSTGHGRAWVDGSYSWRIRVTSGTLRCTVGAHEVLDAVEAAMELLELAEDVEEED